MHNIEITALSTIENLSTTPHNEAKKSTESISLNDEKENAIRYDAFREISLAESQIFEDETKDPFEITGSQINTDLASAAEWETRIHNRLDDPPMEYYEMLRSPMYWKLRDSFLKLADEENPYAFANTIWRAINAGRLSPKRLKLNDKVDTQV